MILGNCSERSAVPTAEGSNVGRTTPGGVDLRSAISTIHR